MKKKTLIILSVVGVLLLVGIALLVRAFGQGQSNHDDNNGYNTYKVQKESPIRITGKISPSSVKTYQNNSQVGDFVSVQVEDGQYVQQGTPLINYDIDPTQRQKLVDQINQANAKGDQQQIDKAIKQLNRYDGQIYNSVNATFSGTVAVDNSTNVSEGEPILRLISNEPEIQTTVSEFDLDKIKVGKDVKIKVTSNGKTGQGKITRIGQLPTSYDSQSASQSGGGEAIGGMEGDEEGQSSLSTNNPIDSNPSLGKGNETSKYQVMIGELDFDVKNGYTVEAQIPLDALKIPKSALTKDDKVFVVDDKNIAHKRTIQYDENNGDIIIKKGLKANDKIIKNPDNKVKDGEKVEVSE
ncbi:efflux RND transporter periplasmic adaptor subunit [Staphylococcus felis]|uniref:efflux RND transporter periplasmic adaptor subunit n=1 Tax=Staphylococcus felis TaxID=46127 RepID=UPI000E247783|nr:HlyD family efflux transporter periplasmic adaptor subunit [Staphylococcus felis]REH83860.1 efflux RND transporter periplasmic adaptor subunit [Staphylococcus felis]REH91278.1 efflux RND transporter periplasmic adaptor subunit [Staphylococcus felis]